MPYIDKGIAIETIRNRKCRRCNVMKYPEFGDFDCMVCDFGTLINAIKELPDEDVEPVRTGNWLPMNHGYQCSVCGRSNWEATPFCPKCGASLELEVDDEYSGSD